MYITKWIIYHFIVNLFSNFDQNIVFFFLWIMTMFSGWLCRYLKLIIFSRISIILKQKTQTELLLALLFSILLQSWILFINQNVAYIIPKLSSHWIYYCYYYYQLFHNSYSFWKIIKRFFFFYYYDFFLFSSFWECCDCGAGYSLM